MLFFRLLKYSIKNILRNKFLSISSILVITLLMFFINILLVIHDVSYKLIESINSKLSISIYLDDDYDKNSLEVIGLFTEVNNLSTDINIEYKSKDMVLEELKKKDEELVKIIQGDNPLPATISLSNVDLDKYEALNNIISSKSNILSKSKVGNKNISSYKSQYNSIMKVIIVLRTLQIGLYIFIAIFLLSISIIMYSIISNFIFYFKDEIYITRLVGGRGIFIYGPFSMQGMIYSIISFVLSVIIFVLVIKNLDFLFTQANYDYFIFKKWFYDVFIIEFFVFAFIGMMSGYLSSRKHLKSA